MKLPIHNLSRHAFSLVEVVLALGVVSFAFIGIMGLLPIGMSSFRSAMDTTVATQIVQRISGDAQETDFAELVGQDATTGLIPAVNVLQTRFFDDQGNEVPESSPHKSYDVQVVVRSSTKLPRAASSPNLATITVQIANNPGGAALKKDSEGLWEMKQTASVRNFPVLVARSK